MRLKFLTDGLATDSEAYDILQDAVKAVKGVPGLCLEIGTRRAGSTKIIIDALLASGDLGRSIVCLDPYGSILYAAEEGKKLRIDYTNEMRKNTLCNLHKYARGKPVNVFLLILEDTEYFTRFADGYPVYDQEKRLINEYAMVFFDGPHDVQSVMKEIEFFQSRTPVGGMWVFDDITSYPHDRVVEPKLFELGWKLVNKKAPKASYVK
jgi:hypothetical protein